MSTPPVSISRKRWSRHSQISSLRSRVTPGVSWTTAARDPVSRFTSVDFPTLGKPTIATVPISSSCATGAGYGLGGCETYRTGAHATRLAERSERAVGADVVGADRVAAVYEHVERAAVDANGLVQRMRAPPQRQRRDERDAAVARDREARDRRTAGVRLRPEPGEGRIRYAFGRMPTRAEML